MNRQWRQSNGVGDFVGGKGDTCIAPTMTTMPCTWFGIVRRPARPRSTAFAHPPPRQTNTNGCGCRWSQNMPPPERNRILSGECCGDDGFAGRISSVGPLSKFTTRTTSFPRKSITLTSIGLCPPSTNGHETVPRIHLNASMHVEVCSSQFSPERLFENRLLQPLEFCFGSSLPLFEGLDPRLHRLQMRHNPPLLGKRGEGDGNVINLVLRD